MALRRANLQLFVDLRQNPGPEQLDALQHGRMGHSTDIHLQDLARMTEQFVQMKDSIGHLVRPTRKQHAASLEVVGAAGRRHPRATNLR